MSGIGSSLARGAIEGAVAKFDEFFSFLNDDPLPEDLRENYSRISRTALGAFSKLIHKAQSQLSSDKVSKKVEKMTFKTLQGISRGTKKFFLPEAKKHRAFRKKPSSLESFIKSASKTIEKIGSLASLEVKKQALGAFCGFIENVLDALLTSVIEKTSKDIPKAEQIIKIKQKLKAAASLGDFQAMMKELQKTGKLFEKTALYFNGIPLFRSKESEDSGIIKAISNTQAFSKLKGQKEEQKIEQTLEAEIGSLILKLSIVGTAKVIFEYFLSNKPNLEDVFCLNSSSKICDKFQEKINELNPNFFKRNALKFLTSIIYYSSKEILTHGFKPYEALLNEWIKTKGGLFYDFSKLSHFLSSINAAHLDVKRSGLFDGSLGEIIESHLESKQTVASKQLYKNFQCKVLSYFEIKLPLTKIFWQKINGMHFHNAIFNRLFFYPKQLLGLLICLLIYPFEILINFILRKILKQKIVNTDPLVHLIENIVGSFSNYSKAIYPINRHLVNHLQKIWGTLKNQYVEEQKKEHKDPIHPSTKHSLEIALFHLFEVLEKICFETPEQLCDFLSGVSLIERTKILASRFFLKQNISAFSRLIAQTLKTFNTEQSKRKIVVSSISSLNGIFGKKEEVSEKDMVETEEKLNILLSEILTFSTRQAIEKKYNFSPITQIDVTDKFLKKLKEISSSNYETLNELIDEISLKSSTTSLLSALQAITEDIQNRQLRIRSHPDLSKNPRTLINIRYCQPIQNSLEGFLPVIKQIKLVQKIQNSPRFITDELMVFKRPQDINFEKIQKFLSHMIEIYPCVDQEYEHIDLAIGLYNCMKEFLLISSTLEKLQTIEESCSTERLTHHLDQLLKKGEIDQSIRAHIQLTKEAISHLSILDAKKRFASLLQEIQTKIELSKVKISQGTIKLLEKTQESVLGKLVSTKKIQAQLESLKTELKKQNLALRDQIMGFEPIEHVNFKLISTHDALEFMQNFAYSRMIGPLEKLLVLLKKPYFWKYGVVNTICEETIKHL